MKMKIWKKKKKVKMKVKVKAKATQNWRLNLKKILSLKKRILLVDLYKALIVNQIQMIHKYRKKR